MSYLTEPSSSASSSSSSPSQSLSLHRAPVAAASSLSSSSPFFSDLDFPLDYGEDYISQVAQFSKQAPREQMEKKVQNEHDILSGLDGEMKKHIPTSSSSTRFFSKYYSSIPGILSCFPVS